MEKLIVKSNGKIVAIDFDKVDGISCGWIEKDEKLFSINAGRSILTFKNEAIRDAAFDIIWKALVYEKHSADLDDLLEDAEH